jgi:hypothetical protein
MVPVIAAETLRDIRWLSPPHAPPKMGHEKRGPNKIIEVRLSDAVASAVSTSLEVTVDDSFPEPALRDPEPLAC